MNKLLEKLEGGNLLSDGDSKKVACDVLANPKKFFQLAEGLAEKNDVVRARTCDAMEFVSRARPELVQDIIPKLIKLATSDLVDMVRWHAAMMFANLNYDKLTLGKVLTTLYKMLEDQSDMVKPWAISTLAILGKRYPNKKIIIKSRLEPLLQSKKASVASRARKAIDALTNDENLPKGWDKSVKIDGE